MSLKGKVAIVTGGNSGIGKAIAVGLAKSGASIVIDYVADPAATDALEREIVSLGDQAIGVEADVSQIDDLQRLVDAAVAKFGRLDIMVNNAGVETRTSMLDTTEAQYDKVLGDQSQERFFRRPDRGEADDQAGRRRPDRQHYLGPRRLADARQYRLLPGQGRHAHADADRRRRIGAAWRSGRRCGSGRGRDPDQSLRP